jgi:hypothetical protein
LVHAAGTVARGLSVALTGLACSARMNAPSRVRNRNSSSTNVPSSASHDAASSPQRRRACAPVKRSPGISKNSPWTRRSTSLLARIGSGDMATSSSDGTAKGMNVVGMSNRCTTLVLATTIGSPDTNSAELRLFSYLVRQSGVRLRHRPLSSLVFAVERWTSGVGNQNNATM